MLRHSLVVALSLATATLGCATHNYHAQLAKRQDGANGGNSSTGPEASDWSYDASFDWGRVSAGENSQLKCSAPKEPDSRVQTEFDNVHS